ncbi:MAG: hypothetical protein IPL61_06730 [Myxococcales bacterium]|nr:hypothetical protein [Myxococcales bacterium]
MRRASIVLLLMFGVVGCSSSIHVSKIYPGRYRVSGGTSTELGEAMRRACPSGHEQLGDTVSSWSVGRAETITEHRAVDGTSTQSSTSRAITSHAESAEIECVDTESLKQELIAYLRRPDARCEAATRLFAMCSSCKDDLAYDIGFNSVLTRCGLAAASPPTFLPSDAVVGDIVGTWGSRTGTPATTYTLEATGVVIEDTKGCDLCPMRKNGAWSLGKGQVLIGVYRQPGRVLSIVSPSTLADDATGHRFERVVPVPDLVMSVVKRGDLVGVWRHKAATWTSTWTFSADLKVEQDLKFVEAGREDSVSAGSWEVDRAGKVTVTWDSVPGVKSPMAVRNLTATAWTDESGITFTRVR